jgi:hypothetical protein
VPQPHRPVLSLNISAKCTGNTSSIWYGKAGSKYCKSCYGAKSRPDKAGGSADGPVSIIGKRLLEDDVTDLELLMGADGRISELHAILDQRCAFGSNARPMRLVPFLTERPRLTAAPAPHCLAGASTRTSSSAGSGATRTTRG